MVNVTEVIAEKLAEQTKEWNEAMVGEMSALLFGTVAFAMLIFYLVNSRSKLVRNTTWSVLNLSVSIFLAVLCYNIVNKSLELIFKEKEGQEDAGVVTVKMTQLVGWWFFIVIGLFVVKDSVLKTKAQGTVGGHILGFAAIYAFGNLAKSDWFDESPWRVLLVLLIYLVVFTALFFSSHIIKIIFEKLSSTDEEGLDNWHDQCKDTGIDFFSMGTAFLIVFFIRWKISGGEIVTIDGELGFDTKSAWILIALGYFFTIIAGVIHVAHAKLPHGAMDYVSTTISLTAAFSLIFGHMWKLGDTASSELAGMLNVAVTLSINAAAFIALIACVGNLGNFSKVLRAGHTAVALTVGLAWEKVFDAAMDGFADKISAKGETETKGRMMVILMTLTVVLVVAPAWMLYIMPKDPDSDNVRAKYSKALADGPFPISAFCCDEDLENDNYGDDDDEFDG
jgi:hypothetical protein